MKKLVLATSMSLILGTSTYANDAGNIIDYAGVGFAKQSASGYDSSIAIAVNAGKNLDDFLPLPHFGAEVELTRTLKDHEKGSYDLAITTMTVYATYNHDITPEMYVMPRVGISHVMLDSGVDDDNNVELSFGITGGYSYQSNIDFVVNYTIIESDVKNLTFGAKYKF